MFISVTVFPDSGFIPDCCTGSQDSPAAGFSGGRIPFLYPIRFKLPDRYTEFTGFRVPLRSVSFRSALPADQQDLPAGRNHRMKDLTGFRFPDFNSTFSEGPVGLSS